MYAPRCEVPELVAKTARPVGSVAKLHQAVFKQLFEEHFTPLFDRFQAITGVSKKILWGNPGAGIYSFYKFLGETTGCQAAQVEDAPALLDEPENEWVAPGKKPLYQPVTLRLLNHPDLPNPVLVRNSCCLWYKIPTVEKCTTCPLLKPDERAERWEARAAR